MALSVRPEVEAASSAKPKPSRSSALTKLALLILGSAFAFVTGEGVVRLFRLAPDTNVVFRDNYRLSDDAKLQYELKPGSPDGRLRISSAGLRDREYSLDKPRDTFRMLVIGDSIAYGFGIPRTDALSEQLEDLLTEYHTSQGLHFEVLNLGVSGYNVEQIVENLRVRGMRYQPDLILYAYCLNDPQSYSFERESLRAQLSSAQRSYRDAVFGQGRSLLAHSQFVLLARYALQSWFSPQPSAADVHDDQWAALRGGNYAEYFGALYRGANLSRLQRGLDDLQNLTSGKHVPVAALVFPIFADLAHYPLGALHAAVSESFRARRITTYDLLPLYARMFREHGPVFVLNALHPNALGVRLAALYALTELVHDGLVPPATEAWTGRGELAELDRLLERVIAAEHAGQHAESSTTR